MPVFLPVEQIIQTVETHPTRWQKVSRESALSLPVPVETPQGIGLGFFWYPVGGPLQNRVVGVPTYRVVASRTEPADIQYQPVQAYDLGLHRVTNQLLGKPTIGGPTTAAEMKTLKPELYRAIDHLMGFYLKPQSVLTSQELTTAHHVHTLFYRLAIVVLLPVYQALNPQFFHWLNSL